MQHKSDENGGSVLSKTVGDFTAISKTVGEFLLCYCKQWECSTENLYYLANLYLRITVLKTNGEWLILCVVIFLSVLLKIELCFVYDYLLTAGCVNINVNCTVVVVDEIFEEAYREGEGDNELVQ